MSGNLKNRVALVFGASGLVGNQLVRKLITDEECSSVVVFVRKPIDFKHPKVKEQLFDVNMPEEFADMIRGDELYICLGTTIRKAGSVARVEEIDRDLPIRIAQAAFKNGVKRIAVVSSMGANPDSRNYYMRIKGQMEKGIREIKFDQTVIARPSMLLGNRTEFRFGEFVAKGFMKVIGFLLTGPLSKYRGIEGATVAAAMIVLIRSSNSEIVYPSDVLEKSGKG